MNGPAERMPVEGPERERERALIDALVRLARAWREERERLVARLQQAEHELAALTERRGGRAESQDDVNARR